VAKRRKNRKKASLKETVNKLVAIAQEHLSKLPEEEQEARVAAFSRFVLTSSRDIHAKPSRTDDTQGSRVSARARE
jgi:hypothetical protein